MAGCRIFKPGPFISGPDGWRPQRGRGACLKYFLGPGAVAKQGIDVTVGNNAGLTGRGYAKRILDNAAKVSEVLDGNNESLTRYYDLLEAGTATEEKFRTAQQVLIDQIAEYRAQLEAGGLSQDAFNRAVESSVEAFQSNDATIQRTIAAEKELNDRLRQSEEAYQGLLGHSNPVIAAKQEFEKASKIVIEALDLQKISAEEAAAALGMLRARYDETIAGLDEGAQKMGQFAEALQSEGFATFESWIDSATQGTFRLTDAMVDLLRQAAALAAKFAIFKGLNAIFGGGIDFGGFSAAAAQGLAFPGGMTLPQGVYHEPTMFKFAKGGRLGILAEAGRSEAVLPLVRGSGGDLGVKAQSAAPLSM